MATKIAPKADTSATPSVPSDTLTIGKVTVSAETVRNALQSPKGNNRRILTLAYAAGQFGLPAPWVSWTVKYTDGGSNPFNVHCGTLLGFMGSSTRARPIASVD